MPPEPKSSSNFARASAIVVLIALALAGGFADAAGYLLVGSFTGHITGNTVLAAVALVGDKVDAFLLHVAAIAAFLLATAGGVLLARLRPGTHGTLVPALMVEAALVGVAPLFGTFEGAHGKLFMLVCISLALGLQNGTFSKSEGVSVHATYITGDATSLLVSLLQRPDPQTSRKLPDRRTTDRALGIVWPSFGVGAAIAGLSVHYLGADALWLLEIPFLLATLFAWNSAST